MKFFLVLLALGLGLVTALPVTTLLERSINSFLAEIADLFPFSGAIATISDLLTDAEALLATVTGTTTTLNDLSGACKEITIIFARGTTEPGNVGVLVGPPFFDALKSVVGSSNVAVQGVDYPASIEGFLVGGDVAGSALMASLVTEAYTKCPSTKIVIAGYSQGGQLVHNAASQLSSTVQAAISSAVIFGDPDDGEAVAGVSASKTLIVCHSLDDICLHGDIIDIEHLTYAAQASEAANFVASAAGL